MNRMLTFDEVKIIELKKFNDSRGFFTETYNKKLLTVKDVLGRDVQQNSNQTLFYLFDDGSVEKKIILE